MVATSIRIFKSLDGSPPPPPEIIICIVIASPCILLACIIDVGYHTVKDTTTTQKRKWKKYKADRVWRVLPRRQNGTVITGALSPAEQLVTEPPPIYDKKAHRVLATVPPEIWREILYHATESYPAPCSIRDFSSSAPPSSSLIPDSTLYRLHHQSTSIKCKLSRVCRLWRTLTKEFRFESVWITTPVQARALGKLIAREEAAGIVGRDSCAWWIRSVHIDATRHMSGHRSSDKNYWYKGEPFISKCPRLLHYRQSFGTMWGTPEVPAYMLDQLFPAHMLNQLLPPSNIEGTVSTTSLGSVLRAKQLLKGTMRHSLTTLDWPANFSFSLYSHLQENGHLLAGALSQLQQLTIRYSPSMVGLRNPPRPLVGGMVHLPALHTFKVDNCYALVHPTTWDLPALQTLSVDGDAYSTTCEQSILSFLKVHGSKLRDLSVLTEFTPNGAPQDISIQQLCPNIEVLQLSVHNLELLPSNHKYPTVIRKLVLMNLEAAAFHGSTSHVIKTLNSVKTYMPLLDIVQDGGVESDQIRARALENRETQQARPFVTFFEALEAIMVSNGVKLLDWRDMPIVIDPPDMPP